MHVLALLCTRAQVGASVKACTKGIWLCARADSSRPDTHVLFLDTEGLSSTSRSENYDARVFALALLLSSYFVYVLCAAESRVLACRAPVFFCVWAPFHGLLGCSMSTTQVLGVLMG